MPAHDAYQSLNDRIASAKAKRDRDLQALKFHIHILGRALKPATLIRQSVEELSVSPHVRSVFRKAVLGIAIGWIAHRIIQARKAKEPGSWKNTLLETGVNLLVAKQYALLRSLGAVVLTTLLTQFKSPEARKRQRPISSRPTNHHPAISETH
jgi:hypothetical protein